MGNNVHEHQERVRHAPRAPMNKRHRILLVTALLLSAGAFASSSPAFANWDGGAEHSDSWNADHDGIYQVLRGDLICESREACGGPAAIPMNRPGYWYLPGGMLPAYRPSISAPVARPLR
jgi:hypothetical protein